MSWVKLDDLMPDDEKVAGLSDAAFRAYVTAICWSAKTLADGRIPERIALQFAGGTGRQGARVLLELVPRFWHEAGDCCLSKHCVAAMRDLGPGVYLIHNYLKYNPSREDVLAEREKARRRMLGVRS